MCATFRHPNPADYPVWLGWSVNSPTPHRTLLIPAPQTAVVEVLSPLMVVVHARANYKRRLVMFDNKRTSTRRRQHDDDDAGGYLGIPPSRWGKQREQRAEDSRDLAMNLCIVEHQRLVQGVTEQTAKSTGVVLL
ncbi:hypothetical protein Q1695_003238 [Nippostrongylus brasiliensis]|nr:hypothetical protein Q1695_003236 [Nippostrongylus brasiliensis]WKY11510.1 hypothetical protein Q1695_003238 [Nippostrongylus brasiliensis]